MVDSTSKDEPVKRIVAPTWWDYSGFLAFVLVWLIPITWVGLSHKSVAGAGNYLNNQYRVASLFTRRCPSWSEYYYLIHLEGSSRWTVVPESYLCKMQPIGFQSRLQRYVADSLGQHHGVYQRQRLAVFVRKRFIRGFRPRRKVNAVCFIEAQYPTGDAMASQLGSWERKEFSEIPKIRKQVISIHFFDKRTPVNGRGEKLPLEYKSKR